MAEHLSLLLQSSENVIDWQVNIHLDQNLDSYMWS